MSSRTGVLGTLSLTVLASALGCSHDALPTPLGVDAGVIDESVPDSALETDLGTDGDGGIAADAGDDLGVVAWSPKPCGLYVAAKGGSDTNPGTNDKPFASLDKLHTALQTAKNKVGCLKAGTYDMQKALILAHGVDDGETWESDPASGVNSATLDGATAFPCLIHTDADNVTIDGLKLQHAIDNLTCHDDGKTTIANLTITNSDIGFNTASTGSGGFPPCLMANGVKGATITHNYIHDCASQGVGLFAYQSGLVLDDVVIDSNVVLRAVQQVSDSGAIYLIHHANYTASSIAITNNFVRDYGTATVDRAHGLYFDEGTNHVVASGNIIGAATAGSGDSTGCLIVDGHDNRFVGNFCDLGTSGLAWSGVWWVYGKATFTAANNVYSGNIVVSRFAGNQKTSAYTVTGFSFVQTNSPANDPTIADNVYYNYGGGQVRTDGNHTSDGSPHVVDPQCSGALYALAKMSPAFAAPVSFAKIVGGWGPPGFVLPPSSNHACP